MNITRITTTTVLGILAAGLLGCSWDETQFAWPWQRQSAPVTRPSWASKKAWPVPDTQPAEDPKEIGPKETVITATQPTAPVPEEPLQIGETREITTDVLPVKDKFITVQEILHSAKGRLSEVKCDELFERRVRAIINRAITTRINKELVFFEADSRLSQPQKDHVSAQIDDMLRGMIADAGGSRTGLEKLMAKDGITVEEYLEEQRRVIGELGACHDFEEGVRAFLDRRPPDFQGR